MDVLSALIAYEQKLTMCLSSSSFYCRLLSSNTLLLWASVQIPLSGALPTRGDGLRGSSNGNWVGRWTSSDSTKGVRYQLHACLLLFILSLLKWRDFNWFCFLLQCWLMSHWGGSCILRACGTGGVCPTACVAWWDPAGSLASHLCHVPMSYSIPDELLYPWAWCAEWKVTDTFSVKGSLCVTAIFICFEKILRICYDLLTSNISSSDIGITVGIIRLKI